MDKDHAKTIPISNILDKLNLKPQKLNKNKGLYPSPLTQEGQAKFWVYFGNNRWYDYNLSQGGDVVDFATHYLRYSNESHTIVDVLRWLRNMTDERFSAPNIPLETFQSTNDDPVLILRSIDQIRFAGLVKYLEKMGIPLPLAQKYMKEIRVFNKKTNKTFLALGVKNENGGYELRNPFFDGCIKPRTITFIRGSKPQPRGVQIFKDILDYASLLSHIDYDRMEHDTILLNSLSCAQLAIPYIQNYPYQTMYSWLDNDIAGQKATNLLGRFASSQPNLTYLKMNKVYEGFKDVKEWHIANLRPS